MFQVVESITDREKSHVKTFFDQNFGFFLTDKKKMANWKKLTVNRFQFPIAPRWSNKNLLLCVENLIWFTKNKSIQKSTPKPPKSHLKFEFFTKFQMIFSRNFGQFFTEFRMIFNEISDDFFEYFYDLFDNVYDIPF